MARRAVITGIGVFSPLGLDAAAQWDALSNRRSGIGPLELLKDAVTPIKYGGELKKFDAKTYLDKKDRKSLKMMARTVQIAVACANSAMADSKADRSKIDSTRFGIEFGSSLIPTELDDLIAASAVSFTGTPGDIDLLKWGSESIPTMNPLWMLKYLPNMAACHTSIIHDAQGPNNSVTQSDVAGLLALGEAYRVLRRDHADFFLVGASDSKINLLSLSRQVLFADLSKNPDGTKACRPFDLHRDGTVISEGVGVFVLEELEHAKARNATIYGEFAGFSSAFDRGMTGSGLARCIRTALDHAGIGVDDVDHVNAHGLSDVAIDAWEARGINEVFGERTPVFAPKSYFGNMTCAGGPVELIASILAFRNGTLPATLNYETPDPACPIAVSAEPRPITKPWFVKVSLTEKGQCAAAVIRRWDE